MVYNLDVKKLSKEDWAYNNCRERAIYIITNYSKTEKQLKDKLKQGKKYSDEIIDRTIDFLKKHHFIDDEAYAKRFIETHKSSYSVKVIKEKLYIKGVKKSIIDNAFDDEELVINEEEVIKKLLLKKCPKYYDIIDEMDVKAKQKIFSYLFRKGFSYENIQNVMKS